MQNLKQMQFYSEAVKGNSRIALHIVQCIIS